MLDVHLYFTASWWGVSMDYGGVVSYLRSFMLARASTKTSVSRVQKNSGKKKSSLAGSLVSRGITVYSFGNISLTSYNEKCCSKKVLQKIKTNILLNKDKPT